MFSPGDTLGPYTLIDFLGQGGFGAVWLAERRTPIATTRVALKIPHVSSNDFNAIKQEAELWASASGHPHVVSIIEANVYSNVTVIVSEYAADGSLEMLLKRRSRLTVAESLEIIAGVLAGLAHLHSKRIIHRDVKPANILLQAHIPRLADFGISRFVESAYSFRTASGTPAYMAPEAFDGARDAQTDLWSAGVVLYRLLTGRLPFSATSTSELIGAIIFKDPRPLDATFPTQLTKVVSKALSKDCRLRYATADEFLRDIRLLQNGLNHGKGPNIERQSSDSVVTQIHVGRPRLTVPVLSVLGLGAAIVAAAAYSLNSGLENRPTVEQSTATTSQYEQPEVNQVANKNSNNYTERRPHSNRANDNHSNDEPVRIGIRKEKRPY